MFRQHVGLVLLFLAAFSITPAQATGTDESYVLESPPIIEIPEGITAVVGGGAADPIQPTFSTEFRSGTNRVLYDLKVDVLTSGELNNFNVIAACFFTSSAADRADERENLCGYSEADPTTAPSPDPDPSKALSMAWTTDDVFRIDGDNSHGLGTSTHETFSTTRTINSETITYDGHRLKFQFALSHAALNRSDWVVRVVAVSTPTPSTPTPNSSPPPDESDPAPQRTELLLDTNCADSYVAQVEDNNCGTLQSYGVSFFGGFSSSTNRSVNYGSVNENSSSVVRTGIETGDYFANDEATLTIAASDFTSSEDEIPLIATGVGDEKNNKQITLECSGEPSEVDQSEDLRLSSTVQDFFISVPISSEEGDAEAARSAPTHDCQLHYGIGASYANSTYVSVVQVGIKDADTTNGPTAEAVEITPSP